MIRVERPGRILLILGVAMLAVGIGSVAWADDDSRPFLGVRLDPHRDGGVRIVGIVGDSAAERAGLREGDVILSVDGKTLTAPDDLSDWLRRSRPGDRVELEVDRDGETERITAELGEHPMRGRRIHGYSLDRDEMEQLEDRLEGLALQLDGLDLDYNFRFDRRGRRPKLGVELVGVTPELREHLGAGPDEGVLVAKIVPGTPAEEAGVEVGDLIVALDGVTIDGHRTLRRELAGKSDESVDLDVIRDRRRVTLPVFIPERENDARDARFEHRRSVRPAPQS